MKILLKSQEIMLSLAQQKPKTCEAFVAFPRRNSSHLGHDDAVHHLRAVSRALTWMISGIPMTCLRSSIGPSPYLSSCIILYIYMYCIVSSDYVWLSTVEVFPSAMSCLRKKIIMVTSMMSLTCRITSNRLSWKTLLCIWGPRQKTQHSTKKWKRILLLLDSWWLSLCGFHTWPKNNLQQRSVMPPKFR